MRDNGVAPAPIRSGAGEQGLERRSREYGSDRGR